MKRNIIVAVTGASGSAYASGLLKKIGAIGDQTGEVAVVFSEQGRAIWKFENGGEFQPAPPFRLYEQDDFNAPFASGSALFDTMIICPCSMGTLGRIASGFSDNLITRAADVMLKERRKLILVPRETPFSFIHIDNMRRVTLAGGIICPAIPSFYSKPASVEELIDTVIDRILQLAGFETGYFRWGGHSG